MVDLTANLERDTDAESIKSAMKRAAEGELKGILEYCDEPLVSADFNGNPHSSIFDAALTSVLGGRMAKVFAWYDNEYGYARRLADAAVLVAGQR
jgi:glyceraldehyde 3-phosphate dehydrogenase